MSEKKYRITTSTKQFETDNVGSDCLKEESGVFYARQNANEAWFRLYKIEKRTSALEQFNEFSERVAFGGWLLLFFVLSCFSSYIEKSRWLLLVAIFFVMPPVCIIPWFIIYSVISKILENSEEYWKNLSNGSIEKLIKKNKPYTYNNNSYNMGSSGNGSSIGSYRDNNTIRISSNEMNKALKDFKSKGKDLKSLVNDTTDEERETLFTEYFQDKDKGQSASEKFAREQVGPARKQTLNKMLEESDYEDAKTKETLAEKINNLDDSVSDATFTATANEIRLYQERKRQKDNHIKYEGRLSNKDIQEIKDHLGYVCMGCGLDPVEEYGEQMKGILEAHHKNPWAEMKENEVRTVKPDDFYILCPNCHRMIHRLSSPADLDGLKKILNQNKKSYWWD